MKSNGKWNKGGVAEGEDRVQRIALRRTKAYKRPTKGELYEQIAENVKEYEYDVVQECADDYIGLGRQDFINLFLLMGEDMSTAIVRFHTEVAELSAAERATYRATLEEAYNKAYCKAGSGEVWA